MDRRSLQFGKPAGGLFELIHTEHLYNREGQEETTQNTKSHTVSAL